MERGRRGLATLVIALFMLVSCGSAQDADSNSAAEAEDAGAQDYADTAEEAAAEEGRSGGDLAGDDQGEGNREVITTASAVVEVDDTREAVRRVLAEVSGYGGYVEDREESTDDDGRPTYASLTVRVPAENLTELIEDLEEFGDVTDSSESARDVTGVVRDLDARIDALETSVERLIEILSEAESAEELLQVETALSERQADLESLQAERNALGDQVAMSTLHVTLSTEPVTEVEPEGFMGGLQTGWNGLVSFVNALLVVTGVMLPWLLVIAVPAAVIVVLLVRRRQRRRPRDVDPAPGSEPGTEHAAPGDQVSEQLNPAEDAVNADGDGHDAK